MKKQLTGTSYENIQERIPMPALQLELKSGAILSCNKAFELLVNKAANSFIGQDFSTLIDSNYADKFNDFIRPEGALDNAEELRIHLTRPRQKSRPISISGFRFLEGGLEKLQLFLHADPSKSEKTHLQNEAIKWASQSELLLKQAYEVAKMGHWELDLATNRLFWSDEVFTLFDCKLNEFDDSYEAFLKFIHPDDRQKVKEAYDNHLLHKSRYDIVHRIITNSGQTKYIRERCKTSFDEHNNPIRSFGVVADITDLIASELELQEKIKLLENQKNEIEELHRLMELTLEQAVDAVITINDKKEIIFANPSTERLLGYSKEELIGANVNIVLPMQDRAAHDHAIETNLNTGINRVAGSGREFEVKRKDGSMVWVHLSLSKVEFMGRFQFTAFLKDISARKDAERQMLEAQNRFEEIGIHTRTMAWQIDQSGLFTYVSKSSKELVGYAPEELEGKLYYFDLHPIQGREEFIENVQKVLARRESFRSLVNPIQTKSGEQIWVSTNGFPLFDEAGNLIGYQGSDTDISQEKKHEEQIYLLKQAIDSSTVSITLATAEKPDFPLIYVNDAFCYLTGYTKEDVLGKNCRFLQSEDKDQNGLDLLRECIRQAKPISVVLKNYTKQGKLFYNQLSISPIFNQAKKLTHFLGVQKDITQLKNIELALLESEANLKALLNSSSESVWSVDRHYRVIYSNEVFSNEFRNAFGHFLLPGDSIISLLPKMLQERWKERYDKVFAGEKIHFTERIPTEINTYYVDVSMNPIIINNRVTGASVFSKNVSAEEEAKQALRDSEERFKSLFTGNIIPMLLIDPLTGNITEINPACESFYGYKKSDVIGKHLSCINASISDFNHLFNELRQKKGVRFEFKHRKADNSLIDVEVFCSLINFNGKEVIYETVHDITDRNNYFKALERQNKIFRDIAWTQSHVVRAPLARLMGLMELLQDSSQENLSQEQIISMMNDSANELDTIIKDIAEKSFVANSLKEISTETKAKTSTLAKETPLHVLLIDDDKMVQLLQKAVIKKQGFSQEPEVYFTAESALDSLIGRAQLDENFLIFLDINMPGMNGWQFLTELENHEFKGDIRVIMLSSSIDLDDKLRANNFNRVIDYQTKPLNAELLDSIKKHPKLIGFF
ncbi:hypothetical protein MASR2M44_10420 [Bacteroidota bacterium]